VTVKGNGGRSRRDLERLRAEAERALTARGELQLVDAAVLGNGNSKLVAWAPRVACAGRVVRLSGVIGTHTDLARVEHPIFLWQEDAWTGSPDVWCNGVQVWLEYLRSEEAGYRLTEDLPATDVRAVAARRPEAKAWVASVPDVGRGTLVALLAHFSVTREVFLAVSTEAVRSAIVKDVTEADPAEQAWTQRFQHLCRYVIAAQQAMNRQQLEIFRTLANDGMGALQATVVAFALENP
jgi:hypothetical protein